MRPYPFFSVLLICVALLASSCTHSDFQQTKRKAEQGDAQAQFELAWMYAEGEGLEKAVEWLSKSAAEGNAFAQYDLALFYKEGEGVPQDDSKAIALLSRCAAQGNDRGQHLLGLMYIEGTGVEQDYPKGAALLEKSAAQGNQFAQCAWVQCTPQVRESRRIFRGPFPFYNRAQSRATTMPNSI